MKRGFFSFVFLVSVAFFCVVFCVVARPSNLLQLLVLPMSVVLFGLSMAIPESIPKEWKKIRAWRWLSPLLVPLLFVAGVWGGRWMRERLFYRDMPEFQKVVDMVASGGAEVVNGRVIFDPLSSAAYTIQTRRDPGNGALEVTFYVGTGYPVKHLAYMYRSDAQFPQDRRRSWPKRWPRAEHWFEVAD